MREHTKRTSTARSRQERFLRVMLIVALLPLLSHCGGGNEGSILTPTKEPVFAGSGTASAPNLVTLAYGGNQPGSLIQVDAILGGPTTSTDLFSFAFYVVLSKPSVIRDVSYVAGNALTGSQAPLVSLQDDRVVVGVTKLGGTGNGVGPQGATIVSLIFKTDPSTPGTTNLTFIQAEALDSQGATIDSITFDSAAAVIQQPK
jgi:hypothetical protein